MKKKGDEYTTTYICFIFFYDNAVFKFKSSKFQTFIFVQLEYTAVSIFGLLSSRNKLIIFYLVLFTNEVKKESYINYNKIKYLVELWIYKNDQKNLLWASLLDNF